MTRKTVIQYLSDILGCASLFGSIYAALWAAPILDAIFTK